MYSLNRANPVAINFHCYGTIEKGHRGNQAIRVFQGNQNALHTQERPALYPNPLTDLQKGPGLGIQARSDNGLNGRDLRFIDGSGRFVETEDVDDTGGLENGEALLNIKSAKKITWEKW